MEDLGNWAASSVFEGFLNAPGGRTDDSGTIAVNPLESQSVEVDGTEFVLGNSHTTVDEQSGAWRLAPAYFYGLIGTS